MIQAVQEKDGRTIELTPEEVDGFDRIVANNREIHEVFDDPSDRVEAMKDLLASTSMRGTGVTILEQMDSIISGTDNTPVARTHLTGPRVVVRLDKDNQLTEVSTVTPVPEDKRATKRTAAIWKNAPSGPKKNDSSFRTGVVDHARIR